MPRSENVGRGQHDDRAAPGSRSTSASWRASSGTIPSHDHAVLATGAGSRVRALGVGRTRRPPSGRYEAQQRLNEAAVRAQGVAHRRPRGARPGGQSRARPHGQGRAAARGHRGGRGRLQRGLDGGCAARAASVTRRAPGAVVGRGRARPGAAAGARREAAHVAADLAPEGRVLRTGGRRRHARPASSGCRWRWWTRLRAAWREALRVVALRVPATVKGPAGARRQWHRRRRPRRSAHAGGHLVRLGDGGRRRASTSPSPSRRTAAP